MVGSRGGFSNADIQIMIETNAEQVNKGLEAINANFDKMSNVLGDLTKAVLQNDAAQRKMVKTTRSSITHLRDWLIVIGQARAAFLNIKMVTLDTVGAIAKVNSQFEKLKVLMTGLSTETDPNKKMQEVNEDIEYLIDLSKKSPFALNTLQDAFVKLKTVGLDPAGGSLQALVDAVAAFGGSEDAIQRAAVALQQMAGKGVVSMEELRQQLGEAVPTALQMMAQGANMSIKDFSKAVATGTVEAISAIKAMNREFMLTYGGSAETLMNTYDGLVSKMKTTWQLFIKEMGESTGLYDTIKDQIRAITEFLSSPQGLRMAREIGNELKTILEIMSSLVQLTIEYKDEIVAFFAYVLGKNAFKSLIDMLKTLWKNLKKIQVAFASFLMIPQITYAVKGLTSSFAALLGVLAATHPILTAIMLTLTAFASLEFVKSIGQWYKLKTAVADLADEMERLKKVGKDIKDIDYTEENYEAAKRLMLLRGQELLRQQKKYDEKGTAWQQSEEGKRYKQKIENTRKMLFEVKALYDKFNQDILEESVNKEFTTVRKNINDTLSELRNSYKKSMSEIQNAKGEDGQDLDEIEKSKLRLAKEKEISAEIQQLYYTTSQNINKIFENIGDDPQRKAIFDKISEALFKQIEEFQTTLDNKIKVVMFSSSSELQAWMEIYEKSYIDYQKSLDKLNKNPIAGTKARNQEIKDNLVLEKEKLTTQLQSIETGEKRLEFLKQEATNMAKLKVQIDNEVKAREQAIKISDRAILKIKDLASAYEEELKAAKQAYEMGAEFDATRAKLEGNLAKEIEKVVAAKKADLEITKQQVLANYDNKKYYETLNDLARTTEDNWAQIKEINASSISEILDLEYERYKKALNYEKMSLEQKKMFDKEWLEYKKSAEAKYAAENKNALEQTATDWIDWTDNMWGVWNDAFESMADKIIEFTKTGKMSMKDLFQSIVDGLIEITIKALMAEAAMAAFNSAGGNSANSTLGGIFNLLSAATGFGGGGITESGGGYSTATVNGKYLGITGAWHTGGIVGNMPPMTKLISPEAFVGATRYHNGGIVGLKDDEVPAILQKGEGVFTKEQMKNLGNPSVTVNVINNTQHDVTAEQGQPRFDGEKLILDVVLKGMNRPGSFRDGMLGATK